MKDRKQVQIALNVIASKWKVMNDANIDTSLADAMEFIVIKESMNLNTSSILSRGLLLRSLHAFDDERSKEIVLKKAVCTIPVNLRTVVVENVCTSLIDSIDDLVYRIEKEDDDIELTENWKTLLVSVIQILTIYVDLASLEPDYRPSEWCTNALLSNCKDILQLHLQMKVVIRRNIFHEVSSCKEVVKEMAIKHVQDVLLKSTSPGVSGNDSLNVFCLSNQFITIQHRRCCSILGISTVYFLYEVTCFLLSAKEIVCS